MLIPVGSFRISRFYYSYSFIVPICIGTAVNSICLRTYFFLSSLVFQSGCKTRNSFCFLQEKFKKFWNFFFRFSFSNSSLNLSVNFPYLRGANVKAFFKSHKLFRIFFFENFFSIDPYFLSVFLWTFFAVAGAKVAPLFTFPNLFLYNFNLFPLYFLTFS